MNNESHPVKITPGDLKSTRETEGLPPWAKDLNPSPLSEELLRALPQRENNAILEIGVGNGRDSIYFAQNNNKVYGIDISESAIKLAEENAQKAGVSDKINFMACQAESLAFDDESFDAVYSFAVLHSTNLTSSISEIARVLKPNGKVIIQLYEKTESRGEQYLFCKKEEVDNIISQNNLAVENQMDFWEERRDGEKTRILVYKLGKSSTNK